MAPKQPVQLKKTPETSQHTLLNLQPMMSELRAHDLPALAQRAMAPRQAGLHPHEMLAIQRTLGIRGASRALVRSPIQARLMVTAAGDQYEHEAEQVADQVMRMPESVPSVSEQDPEQVQRRPALSIQRRLDGSFAAPDAVEQRIGSRKGSGNPLPAETRAFMEPRFGADFSSVRVHTDGEADQISRAVGAQAFTHGRDLYFSHGSYTPASSAGKRLLAHELTHVIQQNGAAVQRTPAREDALQEREETIQRAPKLDELEEEKDK